MAAKDLPETGYIRAAQIVSPDGALPMSANTLWRRVRDGTFPQPIRLSRRVTCWRAEDIRAWLDAKAAGGV